LVAEVIGTYFLIFAGCAAVTVNKNNDSVVTLPGISIVWGLAVMVLVYSLGHISGAHFNPAVTIAFATTRRFPLKQVHQTHHFFSLILFYFGKLGRKIKGQNY
jgi:aquaporin NIP